MAQASSMTTMSPPLFSVVHTCGGNQPAKQLSSTVTWSCGCAVDRGTQTEEKKVTEKALDLVFLMDTTGSMGAYLGEARANIHKIMGEFTQASGYSLRLALVLYRDHPPQETTYVTKVHDFSSEPSTLREWLDTCKAQGGGDPPEAVADGYFEVSRLSWRLTSTKICIQVADAPPHGLVRRCDLPGREDMFPNGCPLGHDPMELWNTLAARKVVLYVVGCEPSITHAKPFYQGLALKTGGRYIPLKYASNLPQIIIGATEEELCMEQQIPMVQDMIDGHRRRWIEEDRYVKRTVEESAIINEEREDGLCRDIHARMSSKGVTIKQVPDSEKASSAKERVVKSIARMNKMMDVRNAYLISPPRGFDEVDEGTRRGGRITLESATIVADSNEDHLEVEGAAERLEAMGVEKGEVTDGVKITEEPATLTHACRLLKKVMSRTNPIE